MSASLPLIVNNTVTDSSAIFGANSSRVITPVLLSVVAVLFSGIIGLQCIQLRWKATEENSQDHNDQLLHGISEQKKQRILAEAESKQIVLKQRRELQVENRELKTQVYRQKEKFSKLSDVKQKCDDTIEQMNDKVTKFREQNYALTLELSELDHSLEVEHKHLSETQTQLNETQVILEETERELHETQTTLEETAVHLQQERKLRMDLIKDFKQLENRLREEQSQWRAREASLRRELSQCKEELEQARRSHKAAMEKCQSEKRSLQEQINTHMKHRHELQERLKGEKQKYETDMKVMQDRLTNCTEENKGYKKALELISIEKASLMAEHKQLLGKFEAALKELDMYTERLKQDKCPNPGQCWACKAGLEGRCTIKNVEYELICTLCSWSFSGETKRPIRERIQEHARAAQNRNMHNPLGTHYAKKHSASPMPAIPFTARITGRAVGNMER